MSLQLAVDLHCHSDIHTSLSLPTLLFYQTVIVGHAVHNDLLALKMIHHCNADTAMLYTCKEASDENNTNSTPSLKNLAHSILQKSMPDVHDSVNDARVALACAEHWVSKKGIVDPIEKVFVRNSREGGRDRLKTADTSMLLVHRLPQGSNGHHVSEMLLAFTCIKPKNVTEVQFSGKHGKCTVEFVTREHAELAYLTLSGEEYEDKTGKKQKRVKLKNGDYVCVRKMKKN
jgi:RNA exonuclease 1